MFWSVPRRDLCGEQKDVRNLSERMHSPVWDQDDLFVHDRGEFVGSHTVRY